MTNTSLVTLYGAAWSVYVRIARLALEEKEAPYEQVEVDVFSDTGEAGNLPARRLPFPASAGAAGFNTSPVTIFPRRVHAASAVSRCRRVLPGICTRR
ncbi:glutathione S-transferase N-terminal domain-containing protein [Paraburkholderia gardini]|uniref:GST N-terminal domain-containing protein n=1 Tax=Paraburkholderia gardini TaxID=2823469 RepID=A0ABM8U554_9BURK|nr:glutathione S-transferase N-terminal domain-containing protein [Paraburkholderia gardini]CAG4902391.1 hypothetical protein R54767_02849 [Paraburkholderia gardini]CAG4903541.1 hypothetical protein R69919_03071 [Paraburkholderia gardini]